MNESTTSDDAGDQEAECAVYLKALGDPVRLQVVRALIAGPLSVGDISTLLETPLANASHHLRVLYNAGIVSTKRDGKYIYYQLNQSLLNRRSAKSLLDFGCCKLDLRSEE
jgi:ArsR family transcriptional regulator, lead/cadmium/zinc/bismuth-responsive transcriptional repressor